MEQTYFFPQIIMQAILAAKSITYSPIGHIPKDYPRMAELCRAASMRYEDTQIPETDIKIRTWKILTDDGPLDKKGRSSCTGHIKFCMLLDFISHRHPDWTRESVLNDALLGDHKRLLVRRWQDVNDELAKAGVRGYDAVPRKKTGLESFSDVTDD